MERRPVGQMGLLTTPTTTPADLNLGTDPDLSYARTTTVTEQGKGTRTAAMLVKVTYTLDNAKHRATRFELTEYGSESQAALSGQASRKPEYNVTRWHRGF